MIIIVYYINNNNNNKTTISLLNYPKLNILTDNYYLIIKELNVILENGLWNDYKDLHKKDIFRNANIEEVQNKLTKSQSKINNNTKNPKWKIFGLIFNKSVIESNIQSCPNTMKILQSIPYIINAGFLV
jgi:aspartyl/asparaginyl beta-hydroxylase (cupin superfamily)